MTLAQLGPVVALAALDLDILGHQRAAALLAIFGDGRTLRFQAESGAALLVGADTQIGD